MLKDNCNHPQYAVTDLGTGTNIFSEVVTRSSCTLCGKMGFYNPRFGQRWVDPKCIPARPGGWKFKKLPQIGAAA